MNKLYVVAREYRHAIDYALFNGFKKNQLVYIDSDIRLYGLKDITVHLIGPYWELPNWKHIDLCLRIRSIQRIEIYDWR